jgi:dTDP-4-dehydrorhamnose reductase
MRILITGANGMLGQDLTAILRQQNIEVIPTDIDTLDITNNKQAEEFLDKEDFDFLIHTAAYTNVDGAETEQEKAFLINYQGTENLAKYTAKRNIPIIYISTDYVFDGTKKSPYETDDKTNPINIYGLSKLKGEEAVLKYNKKHYITRTSWLYGHKGRNFVETIIKLATEKPELRIVDDQIGCPTWTVELAKSITIIIKEQKPYGIYHICGSGHTSWYGFAKKIVELMKIDTNLIPVTTEEYPRPAQRPKYSIMNNNKSCIDWEISLAQYIINRPQT